MIDLKFLLRDAVQKKLAYLRTLSQLGLPSPPLGPIRTNLNWDIFEPRYPSPPSCNQDNMPLNFLFGHELQERKHWICVYVCVCLFVTLLILALLELYRGFQRILELKREFLRYLNSKVQNCFEIENQEIHLRPPLP